jgi:hypothetical protein
MARQLGPDFFIVGAPKCGTTSLNAYLDSHPSVFMAKKEQHYFGSDLGSFWPQPAAQEYFASFAGSEAVQRRGEASGWYLLSRRAAVEIHEYDPAARIIAMVRNPLDMLPSLHSQYLYDELEDIPDLGEALAAEPLRRNGDRVPQRAGSDVRRLLYRSVVRFHEQIERYLRAFGETQVHVILFEDLALSPSDTYARVLTFLELPAFAPDFQVLNPQKRFRSRHIQHFIANVVDPSSRVRTLGSRAIPFHGVRSALLRHGVPALEQVNTSFAPRPALDRSLRTDLAHELADDIDKLGSLLGRNLDHWLAEPAAAS